MTDETFTHITPAGDEFTLADGVHSFLKAWTGFGLGNLDIIGIRTPGQHGEAMQGVYMGRRTMSVLIEIQHESAALWDAYDEALSRACSPFKAGSQPTSADLCTLHRVTKDGRARDAKVLLLSYSKDSGDHDGPVYGQRLLTYCAPDPFFYDPTESTLTLSVAGTGGITFPITFPITFSSTAIDQTVYPENAGDIETWPNIRMYGPGVNPRIDNVTSGLLVNLNASGGLAMDAGDYVDIDMDAATVTWYDASAGTSTVITYKLSDDSTFWPLLSGVNEVRVRMTSAYSGSAVFEFINYYQGV